MNNLHELGVVEAAAAIRSGDLTAEGLAAALLERAHTHSSLNAFMTLEPDQVMAAARRADQQRQAGQQLGSLHGVPIALKDNINTADMPTTAGTPGLREHRPRADAPVVSALKAAGAIPFGKVGMHELAFGITSNNSAFGAIKNPFGHRHVPGGSSGGSAAAVGARIVPASIGSDTGGSVRVPAAFCGVMGFRPTLLRWPQAGIVPISSTRDTAGPLARKAADLAALDAAVTGERDPMPVTRLSGFRIGVPRGFFWEDLEEETSRICESALEALKHAGVVLVDVDLPEIAAVDEAVSFTVALYEAKRDLDRYLEGEGVAKRFAEIVAEAASPDVKTILRPLLDPATAISERAYRDAIEVHRPKLISLYRACFSNHRVDAIVFPTAPVPAPLIGEDETVILNGRAVPTFPTVVRNTDPGSNAGIPGISLPVGLTRSGLPIGLEFDAPAGRDRDLLSLAIALESLFPAPPLP
ncbi:indoleacetamide hydrolase [Bradyrhizobium sp. Ce-3]|uniref:indoleacetamide hydrolase n=1 Tax=Bradyrhizobium sp. Ce-3 TaxID=2913970 RepID=UPI001FC7D524|nr:indoleacetamide hydrolase [Bradyrhizobium sp. Ce-3]GKQ55136.1 indole acetimide hydrolase [Bradyrhizobium sp. Ce-3]